MKLVITEKDYIDALTPFYNGCAFGAKIDKDGRIGITFGCYLLVNLQTGFKKILMEQIDDTQEKTLWNFEMRPRGCLWDFTEYINSFNPEYLKVEIMKIVPCLHCGGLLIEEIKP